MSLNSNNLSVSGSLMTGQYTSAERNSLTLDPGAVIYNKDIAEHEVFDGVKYTPLTPNAWARMATTPAQNSIDRNAAAYTTLDFAGNILYNNDNYIEPDGTTGFKTGYAGFVRVSYQFPVQTANPDPNPNIMCRVRRTRAGVNFATAYSVSSVQAATPSIARGYCCGIDILDCQPDDLFVLEYIKQGLSTEPVTIFGQAVFSLEKV